MTIKTMKRFNENSGYYAQLKAKLDKKEAEFKEKLEAMKKQFVKDNELDNAQVEKLEIALLDFADNYDETLFEGEKTFKNEFVTVSKRASSSLGYAEGNNEKLTLETIKSEFPTYTDRFIKVTEKVDKTTIKSAIKSKELNSEKLVELGLEITESENITLKVN